jgi:hypothetical protein
MGITRSMDSLLPPLFLPSLLVSRYLRACLFQPGPRARPKALFEGKNRFRFFNRHQIRDIGGCVGRSRLFSLRLSGFQSIHKHGEHCPVGVAHPNNIRFPVRIGAGLSGSALSCWYGHGLPLRPSSELMPLPRCRIYMWLGFVLASLSRRGFSVHQGAIPSFEVGTGFPSL